MVVFLKTNRFLTMRIWIVALCVFLLFSCRPENEKLHLDQGIYLSNVTIISTEDGTYNPYIGFVGIEKDKIVYIDRKAPAISGTFEHLDGTGKYLIPGLIDSHVHTTGVQGMLPHHMEKYPELTRSFNQQMPRSYLYYGFTTLIDLGGISDESLASFKKHPLKPDLYHVGHSGAAVANGYPMNFIAEEHRFAAVPNFLFLKSQAEHIPKKYDPADHTPQAVVERIKNSGAIAVKTFYERGFGRMMGLPVPTKDMVKELLTETHAHGLVLAAHANSLEAHSVMVDLGVDILAHGIWNWGPYKEVPKDSLPLEIKEILDLQIEKQIGYMPTLTVIEGEEILVDDTFLAQPDLKKVVPKKLLEWYQTKEAQWFARDLFEGADPDEIHTIYSNIQAHAMLVLKYLADHDGLILFGSDTPSAPTYGNQPGHNGNWELQLMHEAGVPLHKILAAATINNARAFQLDSLIGSLDVGKKANLLLLDKNPLRDIGAYYAIDKVIVSGLVSNRKDLATEE